MHVYKKGLPPKRGEVVWMAASFMSGLFFPSYISFLYFFLGNCFIYDFKAVVTNNEQSATLVKACDDSFDSV